MLKAILIFSMILLSGVLIIRNGKSYLTFSAPRELVEGTSR